MQSNHIRCLWVLREIYRCHQVRIKNREAALFLWPMSQFSWWICLSGVQLFTLHSAVSLNPDGYSEPSLEYPSASSNRDLLSTSFFPHEFWIQSWGIHPLCWLSSFIIREGSRGLTWLPTDLVWTLTDIIPGSLVYFPKLSITRVLLIYDVTKSTNNALSLT